MISIWFQLIQVYVLSFRFGIEMVSYEQEYQSQEEGDIPLLEGFQWESLMDVSYQGPSRKRSLSESSLAPASTHNLFTSHISKETSQRESFNSEQQGSTVNPNRKSSLGNQDCQSHPEVGQMLVHLEAKAQNQTALQRSDSVLGDSSSGTEQCDGLGTAKRRRAAGVSLGNGVLIFICVFVFWKDKQNMSSWLLSFFSVGRSEYRVFMHRT